MKKGFLVALTFFVLAMAQVSFMPHFSFAGWVPNAVLISLVVAASFASVSSGAVGAFTSGFLLDVYSALPFGFWTIACFLLFFAARYILQRYVRLPHHA